MTGDQTFAVDEMKKVMTEDELKFEADGLLPTLASMQTYFGKLQKDPDEALKAYRRIVKAFFIHIDEVTPGGDVVWPGKYCDSWTKISQRPKHSDKTGRRIIDCEGYAHIAATLLPRAGWTLVGYLGFYRQGDLQSGHLAAELSYPKPADPNAIIGQDHVVSGSPETNRGTVAERDELFKSYPGGACLVTWTSPFPTPKGAVDDAESKMKAAPSKDRPSCMQPREPAGRSIPGGPR